MERSSIKMMAAAMLISVMLTGCGDKNDAQSANGGQAANAGGQTVQDAGSGGGPQQPDRTADYFAKVVKVSGDSIVVQKSTMSPADMPSFGGRQGGQRPTNGQGQAGNGGNGGKSGNWQPPEGTPDGAAANGAGGGQGQNGQAGGAGGKGGGRAGGRFGGGGFMNQMKFADEQVTVPVNADTEIVKTGRGQNGMTTDTLKASDLKAGDILMVWVGTDNTTATYIRLQFNPADMGNARNAGNAGNTGNTGNTGDAGKAGNGQ